MRPLSLFERQRQTPTVSLAALLGGGRPAIEGTSNIALGDYVKEILRSGFPGLRAYAAATSTTTSYETIRDAATGGEGTKPSKRTTMPYRDILERFWIVDPVPAWIPSRNPISRLSHPPKHQLADPALAARLLGATTETLLAGEKAEQPGKGPLVGALFESLAALSVRVCAQAAEARVGHLRTFGGDREIDLIVERADGRVLAIEVKLGGAVDDADVKHLLWLQRELEENVVDMVVLSTGPRAYRRPDGVAVVPVERTADASLRSEASLGNNVAPRVRRLISLLSRSTLFVVLSRRRWALGIMSTVIASGAACSNHAAS